MGDLSRAAIILEEGKHYREAAAIYTDHLHHKIRAAECLEQGGLLHEAIALYVTAECYEKAGDLYLQIGQEVKANKYFEETVTKSLNARDNLNASRIIELKLADLERSQQVLLEGWVQHNKPEQCLTKYFELAKKRELPIPGVVQHIFADHVNRTSGTSFLDVLADLVATTNDDILKEQAQSICYQIVHQQIGYGDFSALKMMNRFVPEDQLLIQDAHRYATINQVKVRKQQAHELIHLDADVVWTDFCNFHDQLIGIGMKGKDVVMLRMNWYERNEYSYLFQSKEGSRFKLTADSWVSSDILIVSPEVLSHNKFFPANQFFQREFDLYQLSWLSRDTIGHAVNKNGDLTCLEVTNGDEIVLKTYAYSGKLLSSLNCMYGAEVIKLHELNFRTSRMYWRKDHLYFVGRDMLACINERGILDLLIIEHEVLNFSVTGLHAALKIALLTVEGCLIVFPTLKEMKIAIPLLGANLNAHLIHLLPDNHLVLASSKKAQVYDIGENKLQLLFEVIPDHNIVGIFSVPKRNHFALVDASNRISTYVIAKEE